MPMSPRLLRPRAAGGFSPTDADARAYINAVRTADGQPLERAVAQAIDSFVIGCKADGIWSAVKASCILMGARTLAGALTPLVGTAPTNNNFVSGDYNRKTGLVGNASTKFLNSNRSANADALNNCHAAVYASTVASGFQMYFGGETANAYDAFRNGANANGRSRGGSAGTLGTGATAGLIGHSRAAAGTFVFRAAGSQQTVTSTSGTADNANIYVFARNVSGSLNLPTDARIAFYSIGESLTLSALDSRVSSLYAAIAAAIP